MQLEYAFPVTKSDTLHVLTANDSSDCTTGGQVGSLQTFGPYGTTIAPGGSIEETFVIGRSRVDTFRFRFGLLGNSTLTPVVVEPVCSVEPNITRSWRVTNQTGTDLPIVYNVDQAPEQAAVVPSEGELILSGVVTQQSENVLFISNAPDSQFTFRTKTVAGEAVCPRVQGYKFADNNGNGLWDESEAGLPNWRIVATQTKPVATVTVPANAVEGVVTNLPAGEYIFTVSGQWAFDSGEGHTGDAEYISLDSFATHRDGTGIAGNPGYTQGDLLVNNTDVYWGGYRTDHTYATYFNQAADGTVQFQIWDSPDRTQAPNPTWYADNSGELTVTIYQAVVPSVLTSADEQQVGFYSISVPYGVQTVGVYEVQQYGFVNTSPESGSYTVTVGNDTTPVFYNFGNQKVATGAISGVVTKTPALAVAGAIVFLDANSNGTKDDGEVSFTTTEDGLYGFNGLGDGDYRVAVQAVPGLIFNTPSTGFTDVSIANGAVITGTNFTFNVPTSGGGDQGGGGGSSGGGGGSQGGGGGSSGGGSTGGSGGQGGSTPTPAPTTPTDGGSGVTVPAPAAPVSETIPGGQVAGDSTVVTPARVAATTPAPAQAAQPDLAVKTDEGQVLGVTTDNATPEGCKQLPWWRYGYLLYALLLLLVARFFASNLNSKVWFVPGLVLLVAGLVYWWFEPCVKHAWFWPTAMVVWYGITALWHRNRLMAK
jgi:hypothetical protein